MRRCCSCMDCSHLTHQQKFIVMYAGCALVSWRRDHVELIYTHWSMTSKRSPASSLSDPALAPISLPGLINDTIMSMLRCSESSRRTCAGVTGVMRHEGVPTGKNSQCCYCITAILLGPASLSLRNEVGRQLSGYDHVQVYRM